MKKLLVQILIFLVIFSLVSCGEVVPPTSNGGGGGNTDDTTGGGGQLDDTTEPQTVFTATLSYNGERFIPESDADNPIMAQWRSTDGYTLVSAPFDEEGVATVTGLDGDYYVTLNIIPEGYAYNPNVNVTTNDNPEIEIELYALIETRGSGSGLYYPNIIEIHQTGKYCATVKSSKAVFYQFVPRSAGYYVIESWVDTVTNNVNPMLDVYVGSSAWKPSKPNYTIDGGAADFTSNFRYEVYVDDSNISTGGGVVYAYGIRADITDGDYPVNIYFSLSYESEWDRLDTESDIIVPEELKTVTSYAPGHEYDWNYTLVDADMLIDGQHIFEDDFYRYNEDTGFYHLYDEAAYAENGGYGPILYAHITSPTIFTDAPFTHIEDAGNKALTVSSGTENYKLFIQGYYDLIVDPGANNPQATTGPYLCNRYCPCRTSMSCDGGCVIGCTKCLADCRQVPAEAKGCIGYAGVVNSDGLAPVTQELKDFLQKFAISQVYFRDGNGWAEIQSEPPYFAGEDDQWLFACCYYVENTASTASVDSGVLTVFSDLDTATDMVYDRRNYGL